MSTHFRAQIGDDRKRAIEKPGNDRLEAHVKGNKNKKPKMLMYILFSLWIVGDRSTILSALRFKCSLRCLFLVQILFRCNLSIRRADRRHTDTHDRACSEGISRPTASGSLPPLLCFLFAFRALSIRRTCAHLVHRMCIHSSNNRAEARRQRLSNHSSRYRRKAMCICFDVLSF